MPAQWAVHANRLCCPSSASLPVCRHKGADNRINKHEHRRSHALTPVKSRLHFRKRLIGRKVSASADQNRQTEELTQAQLLQCLPSLSSLHDPDLQLLVRGVSLVNLPAGYTLSSEGLVSGTCYLVIGKAIAVRQTSQGEGHSIAVCRHVSPA